MLESITTSSAAEASLRSILCGVVRVLGLLVVAFYLQSCANSGSQLLDQNPTDVDLSPRYPSQKTRLAAGDRGNIPAGRTKTEIFLGDDNLAPGGNGRRISGVEQDGDDYLVNLENANITEAAKLILGDTLKENYIVDPRVNGTITLASVNRLSASELLSAFEAALRMNGAVLIKGDGRFRISSSTDVSEGDMGSFDYPGRSGRTADGYGVSVVPLKNISAANATALADNFIARNGTVRTLSSGNLILIRGTAEERQSLAEVILSFDVDWMKGQSASLVTLTNGTPAETVIKLEQIYGSGKGPGSVRFMALDRLNAVLLLANSQEKVRRAAKWVARLDRPSDTDLNQYVYVVQNGKVEEMAKILNATFNDQDSGSKRDVVPSEPAVAAQSAPDAEEIAIGQANPDGKADNADAVPEVSQEQFTETPQERTSGLGIRITPSQSNNALIIRATVKDYHKILSVLRKIDVPGAQVLINVTIAEVVLNDNLRYGVQAYFKSKRVSGGVFEGNSLLLQPSFPGLNFLLGATADPRLVLDALSAVTSVRIVSSPSVAVLENEPAVIKVGDQIPILVQSIAGSTAVPPPLVNSIEYRDAGVVLKVTPRINGSGLVTMQLTQELSAVAPNASDTGAVNLTPTISQRSITSKVSVYSEQTIVLGGLISSQDSRSKDGIPGVSKVPIFGNLLGKTDNKARRSELIVFITPQVIRDSEDASRVSSELRDKLRLFNPEQE
jgi:general secretion pathway protein D